MKNKKYTRLDKLLEMPKEVVSNISKISIIGFNEMLIENYKAILEYEENFIKIATYIGVINISGFDLLLESMTDDDIKVSGKIDSMEFVELVD